MQSLLQSAFFQALGYAIANSLWQAALLWLLASVINNIGKTSASGKYTVSLIAQFTAFVWFLFTLHFYYDKSAEVLMQAKVNESFNGGNALFYEATADSFSSGLSSVMIKAEQLLPYLSLAYLVMLIFLCIRFIRAFVYTNQIRYNGLYKADVDLRLFVKKTAATLGIKKEVLIYYSDLVKGPLTIGFLKPLILLPVASVNNLSTHQVEAIILHELAHIRRFDYLVNIFQAIVEITLFFNPFVQLMGREIKKERENSCDDWVLQFQYNPAMYAEALLQIAIFQVKPSLVMNASPGKGDLLPRVKRMLNKQEKSNRYRNQVFSLILITIMLSTVAWLHPSATKNISLQNNANIKKVRVEPLAANIDNPFFNLAYLFTKPSEDNNAGDESGTVIGNATAGKEIKTENKRNIISETITPLALESLNSAYDALTASLEQAANDLKEKQSQPEKNQPKENTAALAEPVININAGEMIRSELAKVDWKNISNDIKDAITSLPDNKILNLSNAVLEKQKLKDVFEKATAELNNIAAQQSIRNQRQNEELTVLQENNILQEKKFTETQKAINENIKQRREKRSGTINNKINITDIDSMLIDKAIEKAYNSIFGTISNKTYSDITSIYTPAVYNNAYTYSYTDHLNNLDSALIIVNHNKTNDSSHVKKIILQIIGNNGFMKTYELSAEVYQ